MVIMVYSQISLCGITLEDSHSTLALPPPVTPLTPAPSLTCLETHKLERASRGGKENLKASDWRRPSRSGLTVIY